MALSGIPGMPGMPGLPMQVRPNGAPPMQMMAGMPPPMFPMMPTMMPPPNVGQMNAMNPMGMRAMKPTKGKGPQPIDKWVNVPPNNTVYVNNLNEKISRDEIVSGLREVFGQYGKILSITCYTKIKRCKGQAWIVFEKLESATKAKQELQNFLFYNKPLHVSYSKNVSDATLKRDGQDLPVRVRPPKKKKEKKRVVVEEPVNNKKKKKRKKSKAKKAANKDSDGDEEIIDNSNNNNNNNHRNNSHKNMKTKSHMNPRRMPSAAPNKTLFLQNMPFDAKKNEIESLFAMYPGFSGVKLIENKPGIGFVEFEDIYHAASAQSALNGYNLRAKDISVTFAQ